MNAPSSSGTEYAFSPSKQLEEANHQLLAKRKANQKAGKIKQQKEKTFCPIEADVIQKLPAHLGWYSKPVTQASRSHIPTKDKNSTSSSLPQQQIQDSLDLFTSVPKPKSIQTQSQDKIIRLYPELALAFLQKPHTTTSRVWLLLRYLDKKGQGCLLIEHVKDQLTTKTSPWRVCGWRQLRNLLRQGNDTFWMRDKTYIWLRSTTKVANSLGVKELKEHPIRLPAKTLCQSIGQVRAHFYASFHSSRQKPQNFIQATQQPTRSLPISRATIEKITNVKPSSQRTYEQRAGIQTQTNYAIGGYYTEETYQRQAMDVGRAIFLLEDVKGQQGKKNATYVAWQLPNSYVGPHAWQNRGRQRFLNRQLAVLRERRGAGNGQSVVSETSRTKRYCLTGKQATQCRPDAGNIYWYRRSGTGKAFWSVLTT